jgi:hypothetical protein
MPTTSARRAGRNQVKLDQAAKNLKSKRIRADHVDDGALIDLYNLHDQLLPLERERAREARALLNGEWQVPLPDTYDEDEILAYSADSSSKYLIPLKTTQRLSAKVPAIMRPKAASISKAAEKISSAIEEFMQGLMQDQFPFPDFMELAQSEGCVAILVLPSPAAYEDVPTLYDDDERMAEADYGALPEPKQAEYQRFDDGADNPDNAARPYKRLKERYRVDSEGNPDDGSATWKLDRAESTAFFTEERDNFLGDNPPVTFDLLSRLDFVPINPRFKGKRVEVDGIIARRLFARDDLRARGYWWADPDADDDGALVQVGQDGGRDGQVYLYQAILKDERGHVFIAYQAEGKCTYRDKDHNEVAVIDLTEKYKMSRVPVVFRYGWHWSTSDPDRRSIPFTRPFQADWRNRDVLVSAMTISAMWDGMPAYGQRITPDGTVAAALNGDVELNITIKPNTIVPVYGDLERLGGSGVSKDVPMLIQHFDQSAGEYAPQPGSFGGDGPRSGVDREITGKDTDIAHSHILEAGRSAYEEAASLALEICTRLGQMPGKPPVSLNILSDVPTGTTGTMSKQTHRVTLNPNAAGENWTLVAEFPSVPGENLAGATVFADLAERKFLLREEFRTLWGDPHPELFEAKRQLEVYYDSPAGQMELMQDLAEYMQDDRRKKILQLTQQQRATSGGTSSALLADLMGGGQQGQQGPPTAPGVPSGGPAVQRPRSRPSAASSTARSVPRRARPAPRTAAR